LKYIYFSYIGYNGFPYECQNDNHKCRVTRKKNLGSRG